MSLLTTTLSSIRATSGAAAESARERQQALTKPPGSLGALEDLGVRLSAVAGVCPPPIPARPGRRGVRRRPRRARPRGDALAAGGHGADGGEHGRGRSGGERARATGRRLGDRRRRRCRQPVRVGWRAGLQRRARAPPTSAVGPAMTRGEVLAAIEVGISVADDLVDGGADLLVTGDMGIANTTPAAALVAALHRCDGRGRHGSRHRHRRRHPGPEDPGGGGRCRPGAGSRAPGRPGRCRRSRARGAGRLPPGWSGQAGTGPGRRPHCRVRSPGRCCVGTRRRRPLGGRAPLRRAGCERRSRAPRAGPAPRHGAAARRGVGRRTRHPAGAVALRECSTRWRPSTPPA